MLSIEFATLKLTKSMQTQIVIDFEQNSQVLPQNPIAPVTFKIDLKNRKKALKFSYRIFDERSVLIGSADADLSNSLLLFDTLLLKNQPKEFIIKNKLENCEITLKTTVFCDLNTILVYENIKNEVRRRIEKKVNEQKIKASIVNRHDLQIMELNQSSNEYPIIKTDLEKSQEDNRARTRYKLDFNKFNQNRVGDFFKEFTIKGFYKSAISCFNCCNMKNLDKGSEVDYLN